MTETARRLMTLAQETAAEPEVAYLLAWTAFEHVVKRAARQAGVRPQFGLRKNGTVQTQKVGDLKMPAVTPPRFEHEVAAALRCLPAAVLEALVAHPAVRAFAGRVPRLDGKPLVRDARGQPLTGVLDVAHTPDPRYPVWCPLDADLARAAAQGALTEAQRDALVTQVVALLGAVRRNLLVGGEDGAAIAARALPLVKILVEGLQRCAP